VALYDSIDLKWTWDGDYCIGDDGDLGDTKEDYLLSLVQEIHTVVKSEIDDWVSNPLLGATLSDFLGEANTRELGQRIQDRIRQKITDISLVNSGDLSVRVEPISVSQVAIMINVLVVATENNKLTIGEPVSVNLLYDTMENNLFFMPPVDVNA
jgi:hypothetical protein